MVIMGPGISDKRVKINIGALLKLWSHVIVLIIPHMEVSHSNQVFFYIFNIYQPSFYSA